jgi:hypothetical protein
MSLRTYLPKQIDMQEMTYMKNYLKISALYLCKIGSRIYMKRLCGYSFSHNTWWHEHPALQRHVCIVVHTGPKTDVCF